MKKSCQICRKRFNEDILYEVEVSCMRDGQTLIVAKKTVCPNCSGMVLKEVFRSSIFPAKGEREKYQPIPHHDRNGTSCHDCGAQEGEFHQIGCDWERCPVCGGQLISCGHAGQVTFVTNKTGRE